MAMTNKEKKAKYRADMIEKGYHQMPPIWVPACKVGELKQMIAELRHKYEQEKMQ